MAKAKANTRIHTSYVETTEICSYQQKVTMTSPFGEFSRTYKSRAKFEHMCRMILALRFGRREHFLFGADTLELSSTPMGELN